MKHGKTSLLLDTRTMYGRIQKNIKQEVNLVNTQMVRIQKLEKWDG